MTSLIFWQHCIFDPFSPQPLFHDFFYFFSAMSLYLSPAVSYFHAHLSRRRRVVICSLRNKLFIQNIFFASFISVKKKILKIVLKSYKNFMTLSGPSSPNQLKSQNISYKNFQRQALSKGLCSPFSWFLTSSPPFGEIDLIYGWPLPKDPIWLREEMEEVGRIVVLQVPDRYPDIRDLMTNKGIRRHALVLFFVWYVLRVLNDIIILMR